MTVTTVNWPWQVTTVNEPWQSPQWTDHDSHQWTDHDSHHSELTMTVTTVNWPWQSPQWTDHDSHQWTDHGNPHNCTSNDFVFLEGYLGLGWRDRFYVLYVLYLFTPHPHPKGFIHVFCPILKFCVCFVVPMLIHFGSGTLEMKMWRQKNNK